MTTSVDAVLTNVHVASMSEELRAHTPYGAIQDAVVALADGRIAWLGPRASAPGFADVERIDGQGGWLTPGLVDCHTHLVYAGHRARDFGRRLGGHSYEQIAAEGGGILSTVRMTREATDEALFEVSAQRLRALLREGVTTVEIKSGYGLSFEHERRQLEVARALARAYRINVQRTFLAAHTVPPEYRGRADDYVARVCDDMLPAVAEQGLADAVDVFCEGVGFSLGQCRRVFERAASLGLPIKGHVEQLSHLGGARLVAEFDGLSADHLEYLPADDVQFLADGNVVPVLLPGAFYHLGETRLPPVRELRRYGLPMAVASDLNPGTSPMASLLLAMNMSCVLFGLTPEEALAGTTANGARALGLGRSKGQIRAGFDADLALWPVEHPDQLSYGVNLLLPARVWVGGQSV
ncbi:MAG: imidazolonepropionase [Polyangiaceae bacterium]